MSEPSSTSQSIWILAEQKLCQDKKKNKIFEAYLGILQFQYGSELSPRGSIEYQNQLRKLLNNKLRKLEENKWKPRMPGLKNILLIKDIIAAAATASPPAAIACSGVGVLLSVRAFEFHLVDLHVDCSLASCAYRRGTHATFGRLERQFWNHSSNSSDGRHLSLQV